MKKRIAAALLAVMVLASCGAKSSSTPNASSGNTPGEVSTRTDVKFDDEFKEIPNSVYTMIFEPVTDAVTKLEVGMNIPEDVDANWTTETTTDCNFVIDDTKAKKTIATVKVTTAPSNVEELAGSTEPKKLAEYMAPNFFPGKDVHDALVKSVVEDFGYTLLTDWSGTALGMTAHLVEFVDPVTKNHSIRYYMCNDKMNAEFFALEYRADIPASDKAGVERARAIVLSLKQF